MGRGDKKSKRGKIFMGTYGNSRPRKLPNNIISEKEKAEAKKETAKKTTTKKTTKKKKK